MKLPTKAIPEHREQLRKKQKDICPLCKRKLSENLPSLDHDHETGYIRGVLCRNCNQIEGRILAWLRRLPKGVIQKEQFLRNLIQYWKKHSRVTGVIHPAHGRKRRRRRRSK